MTDPSDEQLLELMPQQMRDDLAAAARALAGFDRANIKAAAAYRIILNRHAVDHARAALAKYGTPTPQPVLVSERLPGPEDTTSRNQCWYWHPDDACWEVVPVVTYTWDEWSHWLPANAIPIPRPPMPDIADELERK